MHFSTLDSPRQLSYADSFDLQGARSTAPAPAREIPTTGTLETLVEQLSRRMGSARAPSVQVQPGPRCTYSPLYHCITVGAEVLERASADTVTAIVAHEIGHSMQPDARKARFRHALVAPALGLQLLSVLLLLFGAYKLCLACLPLGFALLWWSTHLRTDSFDQYVAREADADERGARLLGASRMESALREYTLLFHDGRMSRAVQARLQHLQALPDLSRGR